jgi:phosphomannomutase
VTGEIRFGTDGWRARLADQYTFANLRRAAAGASRYFASHGDTIVIGHDRRFLAREMAQAAAEVAAGHGLNVLLTLDATPTPVISLAAAGTGAAGAINLTASHNPPSDQGFKVRDGLGVALAPAALDEMASQIPGPDENIPLLAFEKALADGRVRLFDPAPAYRDHVRSRVDLDAIRRSGLLVAHDPMWGAGIGWLDWVLGPGGALRLDTIHGVANPAFPEMRQPEPIPPNTDALGRRVRAVAADLGIATDGDADRLGLYDEHGAFVTQLQVFALLAYHLLAVRGERGPIVKTLSTTSMLELLGQRYGVPVHETAVGFKYVGPEMLRTDALIGGEESGGYAFRGLAERDGLLAALMLLELVVTTGRPVSGLIADLYHTVGGEWHYRRRDVTFPPDQRGAIVARLGEAQPTALGGVAVASRNTEDGFKYVLADGGWVLIRFSGTEPLMRIYAETPNRTLLDDLLGAGAALTGFAA